MTQPIRPGLSYVFNIKALIATPLSGGQTLRGERLHIPITCGIVSGPKLSGTILPGGSDWPLIRPDGNSEISAQYTIRAEDGTLILVQNDGLRVSDTSVTERLRRGETVAPEEYYFRTIPRFEAPEGPHDWLNRRVFVASLAPAGREVTIDIYSLD